jgi:hypothetical protein
MTDLVAKADNRTIPKASRKVICRDWASFWFEERERWYQPGDEKRKALAAVSEPNLLGGLTHAIAPIIRT